MGGTEYQSPPEQWAKAIFSERPGGPPQHADSLRAGFAVPPNSKPRPFFQDAPGAPTSELLHASGPKFCSDSERAGCLVPPNSGPRKFFFALCHGALNFTLAAREAWACILGPPQSVPRPFFGWPWGPCQHAAGCPRSGSLPTVMIFYLHCGKRSPQRHSSLSLQIEVRVLHISGRNH